MPPAIKRATPEQLAAILKKNRADAIKLAQTKGLAKTKIMLQKSQRELEQRLAQTTARMGTADAFTPAQMRATLAQIRLVIAGLTGNIKDLVVDASEDAAIAAAEGTIAYLRAADRAYRGIGTMPLALNEARLFDQAVAGSRASVLRRLTRAGADKKLTEHPVEHPAKRGILQRYGLVTMDEFEQIMQRGLVTRATLGQMRDQITTASPFLQGKPRFWADRIVRTEVMGAHNRASWEAAREADSELGDCVKILVAHFDNRTGADSFAVHGQIRRPEEAFESWFGLYQHPPNRPNDREVVITHRIVWPLPKYLEWRTADQIAARWRMEKRKGAPPERPLMTTVPLQRFGSVEAAEEEKARRRRARREAMGLPEEEDREAEEGEEEDEYGED